MVGKSKQIFPQMLLQWWRIDNGRDLKQNIPPPKSKIDTKNDGLENVSPFKHGYFAYLC